MCYCALNVIQWSHCELKNDSLTTINVLYVWVLGCNGSTFRSEASMVSHRGHNCISSALTILDSALTS